MIVLSVHCQETNVNKIVYIGVNTYAERINMCMQKNKTLFQWKITRRKEKNE